MRSKSHKLVIKIITAPFRIIRKACDLYVKSLLTCTATRVNYTLPGNDSQPSNLYRIYSVSYTSSQTSNDCDVEDYMELVKAASVRNRGHVNEAEMYLSKMEEVYLDNSRVLKGKRLNLMERIEEDKICEFGDQIKVDVHVPKSKSCAVNSKVETDMVVTWLDRVSTHERNIRKQLRQLSEKDPCFSDGKRNVI